VDELDELEALDSDALEALDAELCELELSDELDSDELLSLDPDELEESDELDELLLLPGSGGADSGEFSTITSVLLPLVQTA
jgi:hypothetical protein